jgi:hypothetical protein
MRTLIGFFDEESEFAANLIDYRDEHLRTCSLGATCQSCRVLVDEEFVGRLQLARREYVDKVEPLEYLRGLLCVYCGGHSSEKDHLLPRNWTGEGVRKLVPTVPACRFCNGTLRDFPEPIIANRTALIARKIRTKHRRQLGLPMRTDDELKEYGYRMQQSLRALQADRLELHAKLVVLDLGGVPELPSNLIDLLTVGEYERFIDPWN